MSVGNIGHNLSLPRHRYCFVRAGYVQPEGSMTDLIPCVWWGVSVTPGRMMGCHVLLESGAMVVDLPLAALHAHPVKGKDDPRPYWEAGVWDCFGWEAECFVPDLLEDMRCEVLSTDHQITGETGRLWFAIDFIDDGYSLAPGQHKHLWVVALDTGHFTQVPQDMLLVQDKAFTKVDGVPRIARQEFIYRAEG